MTWPAPGRFKVGDMVTVNNEPGIVTQHNPHSAFPYRIGGAFTNGQLWDAWFPTWQIVHDLDAYESSPCQTGSPTGTGTRCSNSLSDAGGRSNVSHSTTSKPSTLTGSSR